MKQVSHRLYLLRRAHGLKQLEAAKLLDVEANYLSRAEGGKFEPPPSFLLAACSLYNVTLSDLFVGVVAE